MVKRFAAFMAALLLTLLPMSGIVSAATLSGNPIVNNSMETAADANLPISWTNNKWGVNDATFSYVDGDAQHGTKSVKVTMGSYTDGDAKWFAAPVALTAGTTYTYSDYYKSDVTTRVVAAYASSTGTLTYGDLPDAPAASNWTAYSGDFTVPAGTASVTVYHLLDKVGYLQLDNVAIADVVTLPPSTGELDIPNPSVEQTNDGQTPLGWQANGWGNNTRNFEYVNEGHNSSKSVKVTVSNYVDGDAKWYFNPITTLKTDGQYRVKMWYKTDVQAHAVVMYTNASGAQSFFGMPTPTPQVGQDATTTWQPYNATFSVPQGAVSVSVFMYINQNGWLQTDDFSLENYAPQGFSEPMISLTFDDGHEDNHKEALTKMQEVGFKSTQCYATTFIEDVANQPEVLAGIKKFTDAGHEICSHTDTHPDLTTQTPDQLEFELEHPKAYLESMLSDLNVPASQQTVVSNFASPYGAYNAAVNEAIKAAGYQSHRTVNEGYNSIDNFNAYELKVQNMLSTTTLSQVQSWIDQAKKDNTWLILVYHRVADNPGQYDTYINDFNAQMDAIKNSGLAVKTFQEGFTSAKAQADGNPNPGDTTPPSISNVTVAHNNGSTRVDWKANEFANHTFVYGKTASYELTGDVQISGEGDLTNSRYVNLTLEPGTKYFYKVTATDNAGNVGFHVAEFTTPDPSDTTAPVISDVNAVEGGAEVGGGYQVNWKTDETAVCTIEYGLTDAYGTTIAVPAGQFTPNSFVQNIYGLNASTQYFFKITATDASGNKSTYASSFTTSANHIPSRPGDINKDGVVNLNDLSILSNHWDQDATPEQGDLNNDGKVNLNDLSILSNNWSK
jgi:peptidoglycan/xylan/chitin deacetylase (PgdA/CDA1 family)